MRRVRVQTLRLYNTLGPEAMPKVTLSSGNLNDSLCWGLSKSMVDARPEVRR